VTRDGRRHRPTDPAAGTGATEHVQPVDLGTGLGAEAVGRARAALTRPAVLVRKAALPVADATGLAVAAAVSGAMRSPLTTVVYAVAVLTILAVTGQHRLRVCLRAWDQAGRIFAAVALPLPVFLFVSPSAAPKTLAGLALGAAVFILSARLATCAALSAAHRHGWLTERAVVVGAGTFGGYLAGVLRDHPELGLSVAGFVDDGPPRRDLPVPTLGGTPELADIIIRYGIGRVIVCFSTDCKDENLVGVVRACRPLLADICVVPRLYEVGMAVPRHCLDEIWGVPLIPLRSRPRAGLVLKRMTDVVVALLGCVLAAPVVLALAAVIRIRSGAPALFRQQRVTGDGTVTTILKLRTVPVTGTSDASNPDTSWNPDTHWTVDEQRCGRLGRWLRATHLDELPQLLNVLRGEMSLVGPRPERPYFAQQFCRDIPRYADRTRMRGGLTGWAQVHGLNGDTSVFDRARFDNYYAEYWSPWLDTVILTRTAVQVAVAAVWGWT
jgi:exopolysaccharide biosynthesis polyprenyl glycosylphosphotransferase